MTDDTHECPAGNSPEYEHTVDGEYRIAVERAIALAQSALSDTATDSYAAAKLDAAAQALERARRRFVELHPEQGFSGAWSRIDS